MTAQNVPSVTWPARPTCHDGGFHADRFGAHAYRDPVDPTRDGGRGWFTTRTCSYCGSIAPEDLYRLLTADPPRPKLGGSDWKYGWPHKFYVEGIPLPERLIGFETATGWRSGGRDDAGEPIREVTYWKTLGPTDGSGKFYSEHLLDLEAPAFDLLAPVLHQHTGIRFTIVDDKLHYAAPRPGYQR